MEEVKEQMRKFLENNFAKTRWPFISKVIFKSHFPEHTEEALNELFKEGVVFQRQGLNSLLIQFIDTDEKRERVRQYYIKINS